MMMLVPLLSVQGSAGSSMRPAETVSLRAPKQHAANRITLFAQPTQSRFSPNPHPAVDFGIPTLQQHMRSFRFPWLLSNVLDARTGEPLGGAERSRIIEWQGVKVGLMGLVEREWLLTIPSIDEESIAFRDFCEEGRRLAHVAATRAREAHFISYPRAACVRGEWVPCERSRFLDAALARLRRTAPGAVREQEEP